MTHKLIILFILSLLTNYSFGQVAKINTLTVEGKATKSIKPDLCFISMTFENTDTSLNLSMEGLNKNINTISNILKSYRIDSNSIRIAEYSITSQFNDEIKKKEYTVKNELSIDIKYNRKLISTLLAEIQNLNLKNLDMNLSYGISDSLDIETRNELKLIAIRNAKRTAEQISSEMGLEIIGVKSISKTQYNPLEVMTEMAKPQIKFMPPLANRTMEETSSFENFDVSDIAVNEDILITFETR